MKEPKIKRIIALLHTRNERYWGFRVTSVITGESCAAKISGGQSNIMTALTYDGNDWMRDYFLYKDQVTEKELFALTYAGCEPADIRKWVSESMRQT